MSQKSKEKKEPKLCLGQALKDCRSVANLSIESVANSLNLKSTLIRDLEDNLDQIIEDGTYPKIYLRGYLANYAKEIGLSNIGSFPQFQQLSSPVKSTAHLRAPDIIKEKPGLPIKLKLALAALLVIPLLALTLFWLSTPEPSPESQQDSLPTQNQSMRLPTAPTTQVEQEQAQETDAQSLEPITEQPQQQEPEPVKQVDVDTTPSLVEEPVQTAPTKEPQAQTVTEEAQQPKAEVVTASLRLHFKEECWTEIYDAQGKKLAVDLYKAGKELTLAGEPPFNLVLGNPFAVDIFYQGNPVQKQFREGRTARFTLPE